MRIYPYVLTRTFSPQSLIPDHHGVLRTFSKSMYYRSVISRIKSPGDVVPFLKIMYGFLFFWVQLSPWVAYQIEYIISTIPYTIYISDEMG